MKLGVLAGLATEGPGRWSVGRWIWEAVQLAILLAGTIAMPYMVVELFEHFRTGLLP